MRRPEQRTLYFWLFVFGLSALLAAHFLGWISLDAPYMGAPLVLMHCRRVKLTRAATSTNSDSEHIGESCLR